MLRIRLIGRPQLSQRFKQLSAELAGSGLAAAAEAAALPLENRWKELTPYRTGTYRRSIHHEPPVVTDDRVSVEVGTDITDPPYPFYLEFGTSRMPPHPSARPAVDETQGQIRTEFRDALRQLLRSIR